MSPPLLAVDAGGTTTRALLHAPDGTCLGLGRGAGGNPTSSGPTAALAAVADAVGAAARSAGAALADVGAATVAMAGARALPGRAALAAALGFAGAPADLRLVTDVAATYSSAALEDDGCVVVVGTGSCGAQVRGGVVVRVVGGSGWLLGDGGSGFSVGRAVARAAVADLDGTGPPTALTPALLGSLGIPADAGSGDDGRPVALAELVRVLHAARPVALARHAPLAFAEGGDPVALAVVARAQDDLATLVRAVRAGGPGPLVLGGGVVHGALSGPAAVRAPALEEALDGVEVRVVRDGTVGAAVLGLVAQGHRPDAAAHERLRAGVEAAATLPRSAPA